MNIEKEISTLYRKMQIYENSLLEPIGLSSAKSMFLFYLKDNENASQNDICKELMMDKSSVTKMLSRLENDGYITKETSSHDARSFNIHLTDKALKIIPKAKAQNAKWFDEVANDLTDIEKSIFLQLLAKTAAKAAAMCDEL